MQKTKIILAITALSLVIVALAGAAYAQTTNPQTTTPSTSAAQTPNGYFGNCPIQPHVTPYAGAQGFSPYQYGMDICMHGRW
jgi:invasion protein IalB